MPLVDLTSTTPASQGTAGRMGPPSPYTIPFRNDSGVEIPAFAVMLPLSISTADGEWFYVCRKPGYNDTFARRWLVNGPYPVPVDGHGMASDGSMPCVVKRENAPSDASFGVGWGVKDDSWELGPRGVGEFEFLADCDLPSGITDKRGLFRQDVCDLLYVKLNEDLTEGNTAEGSILSTDIPLDSTSTSGFILDNIVDPQLATGEKNANEEIVAIAFIAGQWTVIDGPCPTV